MRTIHFPEWPQVLAQAALPERLQHSFEITIRWYLSFCRRGRAEVTVQSARDFMAWAVQEKHPPEWQVEEWKEAVRWFFRAAGTQAAGPSPGPDGCPVGGFGLATGRSDRMARVESGLPHHGAAAEVFLPDRAELSGLD